MSVFKVEKSFGGAARAFGPGFTAVDLMLV